MEVLIDLVFHGVPLQCLFLELDVHLVSDQFELSLEARVEVLDEDDLHELLPRLLVHLLIVLMREFIVVTQGILDELLATLLKVRKYRFV